MIDAVPATQLFDLEADISETRDVAKQHPDVVARLMRLVEKAREELGDYNRVGKGCRFFDSPRPARWLMQGARRRPKPKGKRR